MLHLLKRSDMQSGQNLWKGKKYPTFQEKMLYVDVHSLQHTPGEFCLKMWRVLCFVHWPGSLHILILPVLFPLFPIPGMPHSHNSLQHGLAVKFWKISWSERFMLTIKHVAPVFLDHVGITKKTHISFTEGFCDEAQKPIWLYKCAMRLLWTQHKRIWNLQAVQCLCLIYWTSINPEQTKTQILSTNKFPDGKRWHIQRNLTNQNPAQKFPAIPVFSLVKKDVGTLSPHFLCQTSDPLIRKAVIQRYHGTHRYAIELNKRLCLAWHQFKKNVYHTQDNQEAHIPTQSYLFFSFLQTVFFSYLNYFPPQ